MSDNPSPRPALSYRADIDGLRAVAVLIVMAFHVGTLRLGGGYVGVDVFFVISGYLMQGLKFLPYLIAAVFFIAGAPGDLSAQYELIAEKPFAAAYACRGS